MDPGGQYERAVVQLDPPRASNFFRSEAGAAQTRGNSSQSALGCRSSWKERKRNVPSGTNLSRVSVYWWSSSESHDAS
ncbi:hypothetical protein ACIBBB_32335 [Streptomyces sp. NPDC051217]|uniref:hypothetical protein n=1 Tax=Streptomyces sp. NPDC051217 TaxID=3365644 RepID=UPI0037A7A9DB